MIVALASFVQIDCKSDTNKKQQKQKHVKAKPAAKRPAPRQNRVAASAVAANVVESDSHNVVVNERPINPAMPEESSVDVQTVKLPDGGYQEIQTTVEVHQEEGKVVETVETWTWYDYAKAAAITAGVAGGAYLAYQNRDAIAGAANAGYGQAKGALNAGYDKASQFGSDMNKSARGMIESAKGRFGYESQALADTEVAPVLADTEVAPVDKAAQARNIERGNEQAYLDIVNAPDFDENARQEAVNNRFSIRNTMNRQADYTKENEYLPIAENIKQAGMNAYDDVRSLAARTGLPMMTPEQKQYYRDLQAQKMAAISHAFTNDKGMDFAANYN